MVLAWKKTKNRHTVKFRLTTVGSPGCEQPASRERGTWKFWGAFSNVHVFKANVFSLGLGTLHGCGRIFWDNTGHKTLSFFESSSSMGVIRTYMSIEIQLAFAWWAVKFTSKLINNLWPLCYQKTEISHVHASLYLVKMVVLKSTERILNRHFTVVNPVTRPMNGSEAAGDLVLIQAPMFLSCKSCCCDAN